MKSLSPRAFVTALAAVTIPVALTPRLSEAAITPLTFADGNGSGLVDQFTGVSGGGWTTNWRSAAGTGTSGFAPAVIDTTPLSPGSGNYLNVNYNTDGTTNPRTTVVGRQWDTTGSSISMSSPIIISFDFRANTAINSSNQVFTLFGSTALSLGTGPNDSWKFSIDGAGVWLVIDPSQPFTLSPLNNAVILASGTQAGTNVANTPLRFSLTIDPITDTYSAAVTRLDTNVSFNSGSTVLKLRNGADASMSFINVLSGAAANLTNVGYSVDNFNVSPVPEPGVVAMIVFAGVFSLLIIRRRHRSA